MKNLTDLYIALLNNTWDIENQLLIAVPKLTTHAANESLKEALHTYTGETQNHKIRLEELIQHHAQQLSYERDIAFETLLQDSFATLAGTDDQNVKDAYTLATQQLLIALQIARYQTLGDWAKKLKDELGRELMMRSLAEEKEMQSTVASLAAGSVFTLGLIEKAVESGKEDVSETESER